MSIKLAVWSSAAGNNTAPEIMVRMLRRAGFEYAELSCEHGAMLAGETPETWRAFRRFAEGEGLLIRQGHLPLSCDIGVLDDARRRRAVELLKHYAEMYHELGITAAVLHCGGFDVAYGRAEAGPTDAVRTEALRELCPEFGPEITLCLENLPVGTEHFEEVEAIIDAAGCPNLGYCLDTGHLNIGAAPDQGYFIRHAGKKLKALHLHDNTGIDYDERDRGRPGCWYISDKHMFPNYNCRAINWEKVVSALREIGYDGLWNLEICSEFSPRIPFGPYREVVLRQFRERAELIFNYDPDAPLPGDPVNDFSRFQPVSGMAVGAGIRAGKVAVTGENYELTVDPVRSGRICDFICRGEAMLERTRDFGFAVPGFWSPPAAVGLLRGGMRLDRMAAADDGIHLALSRTLLDTDNGMLAGAEVRMIYDFGPRSFRVAAEVVNRTGRNIRFAFRWHCLPLLLGKRDGASGTLTFDDGRRFERDGSERLFRFAPADAAIDNVVRETRRDSAASSRMTLAAPWSRTVWRVLLPPDRFYGLVCWDSPDGKSTFEPVYRTVMLPPGSRAEFPMELEIR